VGPWWNGFGMGLKKKVIPGNGQNFPIARLESELTGQRDLYSIPKWLLVNPGPEGG